MKQTTQVNQQVDQVTEQFCNFSGIKMPISIMEKIKYNLNSENQKIQDDCDFYNSRVGELAGFDCPKCKNKGYIAIVAEDERIVYSICPCMNIRNGLRRIEKSGLKNLLDEYTFDNYKTVEEWQKKIKNKAIEYANSDILNKWFFIGGQVGCGKTHICTAIVSEFLNKGKSSKYMLWRDEIVSLKANVMNDEEYQRLIEPLKNVDVLYIDDFFKTEKGKYPTTADVNIAFEVLNYRYNNKNLITILSSEKIIDEILNIDEAVGSRIYQRTKEYCFVLGNDRSKNYRLRR